MIAKTNPSALYLYRVDGKLSVEFLKSKITSLGMFFKIYISFHTGSVK